MKALKIDSLQDLAILRRMAKGLMGHIKAKIQSGATASNGVSGARPRLTDDFERDGFVEMH